MSQYPQSTVDLYNVGGEGQVGIPYAIYPSVLFYKASLFKEAGLNEPPHEWNGDYTMPDGSKVPWDYDTVRKIAMLLTVDENGKDATEDGLRPREDRPVGLRAAARRPAPDRRVLEGRLASSPPTARPSRSPRPWAAAWNCVLRRHLEGPHQRRPARSSRTPTSTRAATRSSPGKVAMSENYLWSTLRRRRTPATTGTWPRRRPTRARRPRRSTPTRSASSSRAKHPDEAFKVLQYLLANEDLLKLVRRHAGRSSPSRTPSCRACRPTTPRPSTGTSPRRASTFADVPELRVVHARLQPDPRPAQQVRHEVAGHRRASTSTPRSPT